MAKKHKLAQVYILTANDLVSGEVVFWSSDKGWTPSILEANSVSDDVEIDALEAVGQEQENLSKVVGSYLVPMAANEVGKFFPVELREQRRLSGPSILFGVDEVAERLAA